MTIHVVCALSCDEVGRAEACVLRLLPYLHELWRVRWSTRFYSAARGGAARDASSASSSAVAQPIGLASFERFCSELGAAVQAEAAGSAAVKSAAPRTSSTLLEFLSAALEEIESSAGALEDDDADACCVSTSALIVLGPIAAAAASGTMAQWASLAAQSYAKQRMGVFWCDTTPRCDNERAKLRESLARALRASHGTVIPSELLCAADALLPLPIALASCFAGLPAPAALAQKKAGAASRWTPPIVAPMTASGQALTSVLLAATSVRDSASDVWEGRLHVGARSCALHLAPLIDAQGAAAAASARPSLQQQQQQEKQENKEQRPAAMAATAAAERSVTGECLV